MKSIELTQRGLKFILALVATILVGILFFDFVILSLSLVFIFFILYDFIDLTNKKNKIKELKIYPSSIRISTFRRTISKQILEIESNLEFNLKREKWFYFSDEKIKKGRNEITLNFEPFHAGIYRLNELNACFNSRFKLFIYNFKVPLNIELFAYPLLYLRIAEAIGFLAEIGYYSRGELEQLTKGSGTEYAYSREYIQGETIKRIDWKATARHLKIFIKEFHEEKGGSLYIVLDTRFPGEITKDELSSFFLGLVTAYTSVEAPIKVAIYGKESFLVKADEGKGASVLERILKYIIDYFKVSLDDIYKVIDIVPSERLKEVLSRMGNEILLRIFSLNASYPNQEIFKLDSEVLTTFIITSLFENLEKFVDFAQSKEAYFIYYPRAYLDAKSLEESYIAKKYLERTVKNLEALGFKTSPVSSSS